MSTVKNLIKKNQLMITALAIMLAIAGYLQFAGTNLEEEYLTADGESQINEVDSGGVITDNYTAEALNEEANLDGLMDLSEEDLLSENLTEIESLDSDVEVIMEDYLEEDMEVAQAADITEEAGTEQVAQATPDEGEIPGEAVLTSTSGVEMLSDAKLLKEQTRAKNKETLMEIINSAGVTEDQKQGAVSSMVEMTEIAEKETAAEILLEAKGFSDVVVSVNGDAVDVVVNAAELTDAQRAQIEDIVTRKTEVAAENIIISTVVQ